MYAFVTIGSALLIGFPVITKAAASVRQRKEAVLTQSPARALMFSFGVWGPGSWSAQGDRNLLNLFFFFSFKSSATLFGLRGAIPARENLLLAEKGKHFSLQSQHMLPTAACFEDGSHSDFTLLAFQSMIKWLNTLLLI